MTATIERSHTWTGQELTASCYINGRWVEADGEGSARVLDPATERTLAQVRFASTAQVEGADVSLVTSGEGVPTSALLLTKDVR